MATRMKSSPEESHSADNGAEAPSISKKAQQTRERILQAARDVVMEGGAGHLTLDAVVARAGMSKGAFLYHFKTKRDLLLTMIDDQVSAFDGGQEERELPFVGDPDPWLSSQVSAMPDGGMQKMSAALLAAVAEDPTLLEPVRGWYRRQYENASKSPRGTDIAGIVLFALDGVFLAEMMGFPTFAAEDLSRLMHTLQALARGELELTPIDKTLMKGLPVSCTPFKSQSWQMQKVGLAFVLLASLAGCGSQKEPASDPPRAVKLLTVGDVGSVANRIELSGLARSSERSTLGFETGGRISKLHVDVGDRFSRGQLLAELDVQPEQLRLEQARATLAAAEAALADRIVQTTQQRGLLEGNVISPAAFESVKAQLVAAEGQVRNAKAAFGLAERARRGAAIHAPFDGVVAEKLALPFTDIAAGAPVLQVDGLRSGVEVLATASTTQAANIKIGQVAELRLSESASPVRASVQRIGLRAENGSLLPVVLVPQDATLARSLRPGSAVQVLLKAPEAKDASPDRLMLPYSALVLSEKAGQAAVFVYDVTGKKVHRREVQFQSEPGGDNVRVVGGLKRGEMVVAAGASWLTNEQQVTPLKATTQLAGR